MSSECEGCCTHEITKGKCVTKLTIIKSNRNDLICPCSNCLVKAMCSTPCDVMNKFYLMIMKMNIKMYEEVK